MAKAKEATTKYLHAPLGYVLKTAISMDDQEGLRAFALTFSDEPKFVKGIKAEDLKGLQKFFTDNGFVFNSKLPNIRTEA